MAASVKKDASGRKTMAEYIKREDVLDALCNASVPTFNLFGKPILDVNYVPAINAIPAADVVEVVRCKDCINHRKSGLCDGWSRYGTITTPDDAYCSYGRKIDG